MNYEQIRAQVRQAVAEGLPISHDDGCVVVCFDVEGIPIWGAPTGVIEAIVTNVMQVLYPAPVSLAGDIPEPTEEVGGDPRITGRWSCRCDSSQCKIVWTVRRDASADPSQVIRATCHTHGLYGDSESARTADNPALRQQAQALYKLDLLHAEQCR